MLLKCNGEKGRILMFFVHGSFYDGNVSKRK
jgi:hypothetical protein